MGLLCFSLREVLSGPNWASHLIGRPSAFGKADAPMKAITLRLLACGLLCSLASEIRGDAQDNASPTPKAIGIPNATPEKNPPSVVIEYPKDGQRVGQSIIRTRVTASD